MSAMNQLGRRVVLIAVAGLAAALVAGASADPAALASGAAVAPTVTTGPVTALAPTTATVAGTVNPNAVATTWHVEYGTTTSYGSTTASASAGSGTTASSVSANLSGLLPNTTYHYRFVATSTAGTGHGADGLLTTSAAPQAVTGGASSVRPTTATLNGTVDPNGRATTSFFEYGTSTSYGSKTATKDAGLGTSSVNVSTGVTGLGAGRTYHFRIVATSDAGTSHGSDQTFFTATAPTVTTKPASSIGDTSARLNGTVTPNGASTSWFFDYGTSTSYGTRTPAKGAGSGTAATNINATVSGLGRGGVYHFRLVAVSSSGTSVGADQSFRTTGPPSTVTGPAMKVGTNDASLTGTVVPNGHSTSWLFEYGTTTSYGAKTASRSAGSGTGAQPVAVTVSNLAPGTTYHFRLLASNGDGTVPGSDASFTTAGPTVTLSATRTIVRFGQTVMLSGTLSTRLANRKVTLFAERAGHGSFVATATVLTRADGTWGILVKPGIGTTYKALCDGGVSSTTTVAVRPGVSLRVLTGRRFATHVAGARAFAGRTVQLQRRTGGRWVTIARKLLKRNSTAVFHPTLRRGVSTLRVAISVNQAGTGYLGGFSRVITYRKR